MAIDITPVMTANVTGDYVASASSELVTELSSRLAYMAFDNISNLEDDEMNRWHSVASTDDPFPMWIQLKFPEQHYVTEFLVRNGTPVHMGIKDFTLQGSNDGVNFTTLGTYVGVEDIGAEKMYTVKNPDFYQYYRLNITSSYHTTNNGSTYYCIIDEIKFYEPILCWAKIDNAIRIIDDAYVKVDGVWRQATKMKPF